MNRALLLCVSAVLAVSKPAAAEVKLPSIFGSHMVLQQNHENPVWGQASPGEEIKVTVGDQAHRAVAGNDGRWMVRLKPMSVGDPLTMTVQGENTITYEDVLVGAVWICSGQSNMAWAVASANDADLEISTSKYPDIRLISVPQVGTQEPQDDFKGAWERCSPRCTRSRSSRSR